MNQSVETRNLHDGWKVYRCEAGAIDDPVNVSIFSEPPLLTTTIPGSLFRGLGVNRIDTTDVEDYDWWYCCEFNVDSAGCLAQQLHFERLATLADIWLNGSKIAVSNNMFTPVTVDVTLLLRDTNQLLICFRSVNTFLQSKRPRPRWKTNLVNHQQLRWLRTSLLGRIPAWTPPTLALGPCGTIALISWPQWQLKTSNVHTSLLNNKRIVNVTIEMSANTASAQLIFGSEILKLVSVDSDSQPGTKKFIGTLTLEAPNLWWPHTHGEPHLYQVRLSASVDGCDIEMELGQRGFRSLALSLTGTTAEMRVNGVQTFCRGACWTSADMTRFHTEPDKLRRILQLAQSAGLNMLRIGGTMYYEQDEFYQLCDELGIMVWQDFMFANMDYPVDDTDFRANITAEVRSQLARLSPHSCVAVYCGSSEIQQQAAMMGVEPQHWSNDFFDTSLPALCQQYHPGVPYIPSTPSGGAMPFHIGEGVTHFYGVGNYKRGMLESGFDKVKFTSECLGFSNIPEPEKVEKLFAGNHPACHTPTWKQGVPRDAATGQDFEDVRDYYLKTMFHTDPVLLRSRDTLRYLAMSRVVTGELINRVMAHWRSTQTPCGGALLWFYNDLVPGAGWGLLDSDGTPKATYYYLKRACQPLAGLLLDQGLDGLGVTVINDTACPKQLRLEIKLISCPDVVVEQRSVVLSIEPHSSWLNSLDTLIGHFRDLNYSYQFGPLQHQIVCLHMYDQLADVLVSEDYYFVHSLQLPIEGSANISAQLEQDGDSLTLAITSDRFLQAVALDINDCFAESNYFHLTPNVTKKITLTTAKTEIKSIKGYVSALNLATPVRLRVNKA